MKNLKLLLVLSVVMMVFPKSAFALRVSSPLAVDNGTITCTNCSTAAGTLASNGVVIGGGSKAVSTISLNATATKMYLSQTSSGTPSFAEIVIGDLASFDSAALFNKMTGETGSASGTPVAVFNQNPTLNGVTGTGTWGLTGATVNLPSGAVDLISEVANGIKSGGSNAVTIATIGSTSLVNGQCVQADANGNLVPSGGACGGTSLNPRIIVHTETPVTVTNATPIYMSFGGVVSSTEADARTPFPSATTFGAISCVAKAATTNAIIATVGENGCTTGADFSSKLAQTLSATANTVQSDSGTTVVAQDECGVIRLSTASGDAAQADVVCTLEITG